MTNCQNTRQFFPTHYSLTVLLVLLDFQCFCLHCFRDLWTIPYFSSYVVQREGSFWGQAEAFHTAFAGLYSQAKLSHRLFFPHPQAEPHDHQLGSDLKLGENSSHRCGNRVGAGNWVDTGSSFEVEAIHPSQLHPYCSPQPCAGVEFPRQTGDMCSVFWVHSYYIQDYTPIV